IAPNPYIVNGFDDPLTNTKLKFYYNGYSVKTSLVQNLINLNLGNTYGKNVKLWSADPSIDVLGGLLATVGVKEYDGDESDVDFNPAILNIGLLSALRVVESNSNNIRCVRN